MPPIRDYPPKSRNNPQTNPLSLTNESCTDKPTIFPYRYRQATPDQPLSQTTTYP
ncbi:uncharacterized protein BDW43DRAFT_262394 [Aspergillus alliaceus]|uniref:uncharacterized protein n=1 Tax=Petromyces alliaceus TaxID=209559 RepID=UPI0012A3BEB9|nr:uncharacterized protein BDW43DRAFT_262394 [Aspergillus alliaceus]KAB8238691.1 hypothetical protein BDW43DRAFT_262394 [Aspergillus alliaceus]